MCDFVKNFPKSPAGKGNQFKTNHQDTQKDCGGNGEWRSVQDKIMTDNQLQKHDVRKRGKCAIYGRAFFYGRAILS